MKRGAEVESIICNHLLPVWANAPLEELRRRDALKILDALLDDGRNSTSQHVYETLKRLGNYAVERDELETSPFGALKPPIKKEPRQVHLNDGQIRALWPAWTTMGFPFGEALKLLLLTGLRLREVAEARWDEIDLAKNEWIIEHQRTKMARPQLVPFSSIVREIVEGLPRFEGPYIFTTTGGARPVSSFSKTKERADALSGVSGWRIHDLRRTVRTKLAELGINDTIAERVLGHAPAKLIQTYNVYQYRDEKADALERWAMRLREILEPPPENVVALRAAAE